MPTTLTRRQMMATSGATALWWSTRALAELAAEPLMTRAIPGTGERLPIIGLGTASSFARADLDARLQVVKTLLDGGASLIDTAPVYLDAEAATGEVLQRLGARQRAFLATKVLIDGKAAGVESFEKSFRLLKTDVIDLMQVHNLRDTDTHLATMREYKEAGRFRYIGVTHWQSDQHDLLVDALNRYELDFVQLNYSVEDRSAENRLLPMARDKGIAVIVNVPLGRGELLKAVSGRQVPVWAGEMGCDSFAQMLLKFVMSDPAVTSVISATSKPKHMIDNLGAARGRLPDPEERARIIEYWQNV